MKGIVREIDLQNETKNEMLLMKRQIEELFILCRKRDTDKKILGNIYGLAIQNNLLDNKINKLTEQNEINTIKFDNFVKKDNKE